MIDRFIRFVAQDSHGQCFLWAMHWGEAGYSCRSTRLTDGESEKLYDLLARQDREACRSACDLFAGSDPAPRHGAFARAENAARFFGSDRDPDLSRWTRVMFEAIYDSELS